MNSRRRNFQDILVILVLQGTHKPNVNLPWVPVNHTIIELITNHKMFYGKKMFLSITKNWGSDA